MGGSESKAGGGLHPGPMRRWDWGKLSTEYAEDMLKLHAANSGDFIVRRSQKLGGYCISVLVTKDEVRHFPVNESSDGWFTVGEEISGGQGKTPSPGRRPSGSLSKSGKALAAKKFGSIPELVQFFTSPGKSGKLVYRHFGCFLVRPMPKVDESALPQIFRKTRKGSGKGKGDAPSSPNFSSPMARKDLTGRMKTGLPGRSMSTSAAPAPPPPRDGIRQGASFSGTGMQQYGNVGVGGGMLPGQALAFDQASFDAQRKLKAKLRHFKQRRSMVAGEMFGEDPFTSYDSDEGDGATGYEHQDGAGSDYGDDGTSSLGSGTHSAGSSVRRRNSLSESALSATVERRMHLYANMHPDGSPIGAGPITEANADYAYHNRESLGEHHSALVAAGMGGDDDDDGGSPRRAASDGVDKTYQNLGSSHYGFSEMIDDDDDGDGDGAGANGGPSAGAAAFAGAQIEDDGEVEEEVGGVYGTLRHSEGVAVVGDIEILPEAGFGVDTLVGGQKLQPAAGGGAGGGAGVDTVRSMGVDTLLAAGTLKPAAMGDRTIKNMTWIDGTMTMGKINEVADDGDDVGC